VGKEVDGVIVEVGKGKVLGGGGGGGGLAPLHYSQT